MNIKERRERFNCLAQTGCCICRKPAQIHHLTGLKYRGMGQKADDAYTIPLCYNHHVGAEGIHNSILAWEKEHGTQLGWLRMVNMHIKWDGEEL